MNIAPRHFRKHLAYIKRTRENLEKVRRLNQRLKDIAKVNEKSEQILSISCQPTVDCLPDPPVCIEPLAEAHECLCAAKCEVCACVPPHAAAEEKLQNNAEVEKVLSDGNAKEHMAAAKAYVAPIQLSFWQRFKLWFGSVITDLCSHRQGGVNYRPIE